MSEEKKPRVTKGRCPCGQEGPAKKIFDHQTSCKVAMEAAARGEETHPRKVYQAYREWLVSEERAEAKEEAKQELHEAYRVLGETKNARHKLRWGSHLTEREAEIANRKQWSEGESGTSRTVQTLSVLGEKVVDGVRAQEILDDPDAYTVAQVLRAKIALGVR